MKRKIFGAILIVISFLLVSLNTFKLTGGVIGVFSLSLNLIALTFLILGLAWSIRPEVEGHLGQLVRTGAVITDPRKLKKLAREVGYTNGRDVREGYQIFGYDGKPLTVIPHRHVSPGVARDILKVLSTGESNFRRYQHNQ